MIAVDTIGFYFGIHCDQNKIMKAHRLLIFFT